MSRRPGGPLLLAIALAACASPPARDLDLEQVRAGLAQAGSDEEVRRYAPAELEAARSAVANLATSKSTDPDERAHLAYLAERRLELARARASERASRERLVELEREHDRILVQASLAEAERARREAEQLRLEAIAAAEDAERARADREAALGRAEAIAAQADLAKREADQAQRLALAREREAALARQEAELATAEASSLRRQLQNLQALETDRGLMFTLGDVLFETAQAELKPESLANLERLVGFIQDYPERRVSIEGHTDSTGSENFNLALSQRRAEAVREALVDRGIAPSRLDAVGLGEAYPISSNETEAGRSQNRRVEIVILKDGETG